MASFVSKFLKKAQNNPWLFLIIFIVITSIGAFFTTRLGLNTNLNKLLPEKNLSVKTAREAGKRVGSTDFLIIAIEGSDPLLNKQVADETASLMKRNMPQLSEVVVKLDLEFFKRNGLLWYDLVRLKKIDKQLKKVLGREKLKSMGLLVTGDAKDPETEKLEKLIRDGKSGGVMPSDLKDTPSRPHELEGYLASADGKILAVIGKPHAISVDMKLAANLVKDAQKIIDAVKKKHEGADLKIEVGGGYKNRVREYNSILKDVASSFAASFALVALIVIIFFRSFRPLPLIFIPLLSGILITLGITSLTGMKQLNIITVFIGGVLLGMGIDFGVYLCARYLEERKGGRDVFDALEITLLKTGGPLVTAAGTTAAALFLLYFSSFRGFWEFGLLAGGGIIITLLVFFFFFPIGAIISEKILPVVPVDKKEEPEYIQKFPVKSVVLISIGLVFTIIIVFAGLRHLEFETNFRRLSGKGASTTIKYGKAMGDNASPTIMLCETRSDCDIAASYFKKILSEPLPDPDLRDYLALPMFIPENQKEKLEVIRNTGKQIQSAHSWADDKMKEKLQKWIKYIPEKEVEEKHLPPWILSRFKEKNGDFGKFIYLYPARETWNAHESRLFKKKYQVLDVKKLSGGSEKSGKVRASGSSFILVDIIDAVKKEGTMIFFLALGMVFLFLLFDFRSFTSACIVSFPLIIALLWLASVLPLLGQKLGLYNMVVLSTIIGTGIDSSVHLYHALTEDGVNIYIALKRAVTAAAVASLTTMAGFSGMMMATHGGLGSIGRLATIGILCTLISAVIFVPSGYFILRYYKKEK
ncbi:MMPL family transporter [Myxococcota bacterium]|nr:MMPL family transporter [Myxococcota bacterium]MBU1380500.1 MMPL family transporter [Myxococcota bacterium]MBU1497272.1 MMPL family transporter [Myxococcota bacterium]